MSKQMFMVVKVEAGTGTLRCLRNFSDRVKAEEVAATSFGFVIEATQVDRLPVVKKATPQLPGEKSVSTLVVDAVEE